MKHLSIDIETLGTNTLDAPIVQIAAVFFDPLAGVADMFGDTFEFNVELEGNGVMDTRTVLWWLQQAPEAQQAVFGVPRDGNIIGALSGLRHFLRPRLSRDSVVWANGPTFDCSILKAAWERVKDRIQPYAGYDQLEWPIRYGHERCIRTIKSLRKVLKIEAPERDGTFHNALDDAKHQARCVAQVWRAVDAVADDGKRS